MKQGLSRNQIKYIVIIAMLVDHIAWLFVPFYTPAGEAMHFIGRLTGPTMAVFVAEGYRYTRDVNRYTLRMALFALVSWPCFSFMEYGRIEPDFGVIYTLLLALLAIRVYESKMDPLVRVLLIGAIVWASGYGDWAYYDIAYALIAHIWHDDRRIRWSLHACLGVLDVLLTAMMLKGYGWPVITAFYELGVLLVPPMLIFLYNGEGGSRHPFHKWFFYVFYPLHMVLLRLFYMMLRG